MVEMENRLKVLGIVSCWLVVNRFVAVKLLVVKVNRFGFGAVKLLVVKEFVKLFAVMSVLEISDSGVQSLARRS